jgi:hypothetical protein
MEDISVVSRDAIPPISSVNQDGEVHQLGELRDFRWNDKLRNFMPDSSAFSVSWVRLGPGEVLFYEGSGQLLGDLARPVAADDVVLVPGGCLHGFVGGPDGLAALSIQFGEGLYTSPEKPRVMFADSDNTLAGLLAYNEERIKRFLERPIFTLLADGTLEDARKRKAYNDALQIWVDGNQLLLLSRQATCVDPAYQGVFLKHMNEEIGHDLLHKERPESERIAADPAPRDSIIEAIANWFTYQMFVLDNAEKAAIIHLVIENASSVYHRHARPALAKYVNNYYFDVHVDADAEHAAMGVELLKNQSARGYARLRRIVGEAWDMIEAMTDRLVEITRAV